MITTIRNALKINDNLCNRFFGICVIKRAERGFSELSQKTRGRILISAPPSIHNIVTLSITNSTPDRMEDGPVYVLERTI